SSSPASLSESGEPIRNSPAGIRTISSFTPLPMSNVSSFGRLFVLLPASLGSAAVATARLLTGNKTTNANVDNVRTMGQNLRQAVRPIATHDATGRYKQFIGGSRNS